MAVTAATKPDTYEHIGVYKVSRTFVSDVEALQTRM